jgi:hypothetical protein
MAFPASLTLVTVTIQLDLPPTGGATGWLDFTAPYPLQGSSVVAPFTERVYLTAAGAATVQLPATNDPQWSPTGWAYTVTGRIGTAALKGTLQLDYQSASADFAALFQPDGAAIAGQTYIALTQRSVAGGVAGLDIDGDVINASGAKVTGGAATSITASQISDSTATGRAVLTAANAAAARSAISAAPVIQAWNGSAYTAATTATVYVGPNDPGAVPDGSVWIDTTP